MTNKFKIKHTVKIIGIFSHLLLFMNLSVKGEGLDFDKPFKFTTSIIIVKTVKHVFFHLVRPINVFTHI